jgi:hypothetical protein
MTFKHQRLQQGELPLETWFMTYDIGDGKGNNYWQNGYNDTGPAGSMNSWAMSNSVLYAVPLWAGARPFLLKQYGIGIYSIGTGGFALTIGIYEDTWDPAIGFRYPGKKVHDFQLTNVTATGFKSYTFSTPLKLAPNKFFWGAVMKDNVGSCNIAWRGLWRYGILGRSVDWSWPTTPIDKMYVSTTYGASLPDPYPSSATEDRIGFSMWMREPNQSGT